MSRFEDMLKEAAHGPVSFDHKDVARRVRRRRRTRLSGVAAVAAFGVIGVVAGLVVGAGDGDERVDTAGDLGGMVTIDELVADRWVVFAYSEVTVGVNPPPFIEFGADGKLVGVDGCQSLSGTWKFDGARLDTSLQSVESSTCAGGMAGLVELLVDDPLVDRFDEGSDNLRLSSGDDFFGFQRFDRLGDVPTVDSLQGDWISTPDGESGTVSLETDGAGVIEIAGCSQDFEWTLDGDRLEVDGLSSDGLECGDGVGVGGGPLLTLTSNPRVRVHESMWLSSDVGVELFSRSDDLGPELTTTSLPDEQTALAIDYVVASSDGVRLHDRTGQTIDIEDGPAAVAFAIDSDLVVYQPASADHPGYPPTTQGDPVVWTAGEERNLPVNSDAVNVRLLDVRMLNGRPVALVSEVSGYTDPDDTFEELVLFDLGTLERTTIVRRPAWESGHVAARLLPGGDVVGLFSAESLTLLARWTPGENSAVWTAEVAADRQVELTMSDERIRVLAVEFDEDFTPVLRVQNYTVDGVALDTAEVAIADPAAQLGAGIFCTDWYDDVRVLCGRSDGSPIVVTADTGAFEQLAESAMGYPSIVRPGE